MTSIQMQCARYLSDDNSNSVRSGSFDCLPDALRDRLDWQNKLRDDLTLLGTASDRLTIREHKKAGARPDDFDFSYPHAVDVLHWRQLNDNRFIPRTSHNERPRIDGMSDGECIDFSSASQSCSALDCLTFDSIRLGQLSLGPTRESLKAGASFIQLAGQFSIAKTGNPKITTQISKANNAIAAVINLISQPIRDS